jgi:two-component system, OmpR family, response regulator
MRLLVVEDDSQIADALLRGLGKSGHQVDCLGNGLDALSALGSADYDLVILDLGLPGADGFSVLRSLRHQERHTPVLIISARDELKDRVDGLDLGADDYLVKPFEFSELEARIRAVARRALAGTGGDIIVGSLRYRVTEHCIYVNDEVVELSPREFGVLEILLLRRGRVVSKASIQDHLCTWGEELTDSAIELYIHRVRKKIDMAGLMIRTVRGFGYMLQAPGAK